jgi:hypothetical protein
MVLITSFPGSIKEKVGSAWKNFNQDHFVYFVLNTNVISKAYYLIVI